MFFLKYQLDVNWMSCDDNIDGEQYLNKRFLDW